MVLEKILESPLDFKEIKAVHALTLNIHWKDWCWSLSANTLAPWCEELIHWKRTWCWERLRARGEGDDRGWDGWMASLTQRTWVWTYVGDGERQGSLACCSPWGFRVRHNWAPEQIHYDIHRALTFQEISAQIKLILVFTFSENKYPSFSCI